MMKLWWTWLSVAAVGALGASAGTGCGDDGNGGAGGLGGASSSSPSASSGPTGSSSSSGMMAGSGGMMAGSGGMMAGSGGGMMAGSGGAGGSGGYEVCSDCTAIQTGAYSNECKTQYDACKADAGCLTIFDCASTCTVDQAGGCCGLKCFANAQQASVDLFKALDGCIYCQTCNKPMLCETDAYCAVFEPGGEAVCPP